MKEPRPLQAFNRVPEYNEAYLKHSFCLVSLFERDICGQN